MRAKLSPISPSHQPLNPALDKRLAAYATAASAVGVALLACAPLAEAKVVYTQTRASIGGGVDGRYNLDLNDDGVVDFGIGFCSCEPEADAITVSSMRNVGNMAIEQPGFSYSAAALFSGAPIGPKQAFKFVYGGGAMQLAGAGYSTSGKPTSFGPWLGVTGRYLGLKFMINGEVHFGWARMTVGKRLSHVVLTGYAYETIPNRPIKAGQISETPQDEVTNADSTRTVKGPSLGVLACGAEVLQVWRRKEEVA